jgi:hypothetical protein
MTDMRDPNDPAAIDPKIAKNGSHAGAMPQERQRSAGSMPIIIGFLAVVIAITALAINSHHQEPGQAAIDAPPGAPGTAGAPVTTGTENSNTR